ncbi:Thiol-disulfide isomerase or thioredoxin [Lutibacter oricola]|uniref:Thiol-disulfide isomerase or thioredoxin n=1 Tax=Lutibacter oricola TaxID=762486 RepID=A0A1H3D3C2_9FLAO|nr:TlpA disulfide reductase family protein [Lutibacter oricola]SDX60901.1 Thiol-disulfide isomerase or thioredoxin [Lutibacter oricola]
MFKKLVFFCTLTLTIVGCTKQPKSFSISGEITSEKNSYAVLSKIDNIYENSQTIIDTLHINKKGEFNAVYFLPSAIYNLKFQNKTIQLALNNNQHLKITGKNTDNLKFKGSKDTQLLVDYEAFRIESLNRLVKSVRKQVASLSKTEENANKIIELRALEIENYTKHINELTEFVKEKMGTSIAVYPTSTRWKGENNLDFYKQLVSNFEDEHPTSEITQQLNNKVNILEKTTVGSTFSTIDLPNNNGEIISLANVKKTYTLIDFWASWCPPCRAESKLLNQTYLTYKSKGFEIYGVSLDKNKERWLKALKKDNRVWPNVSNLKGFKTSIAKEYGITALPTNYLIDSSGKIIAVDIHGKKLKQKIEELLN